MARSQNRELGGKGINSGVGGGGGSAMVAGLEYFLGCLVAIEFEAVVRGGRVLCLCSGNGSVSNSITFANEPVGGKHKFVGGGMAQSFEKIVEEVNLGQWIRGSAANAFEISVEAVKLGETRFGAFCTRLVVEVSNVFLVRLTGFGQFLWGTDLLFNQIEELAGAILWVQYAFVEFVQLKD